VAVVTAAGAIFVIDRFAVALAVKESTTLSLPFLIANISLTARLSMTSWLLSVHFFFFSFSMLGSPNSLVKAPSSCA